MSLMLVSKVDTVANTPVVVGGIPSSATIAYAMINIYVVNTTPNDANVNVYISDTDTPTQVDTIEYMTKILGGSSNGLELTHLVCLPGERIIVQTDIDGLNAQIRGYTLVNVPTEAYVVKKVLTANTDEVLYTIPPDVITSVSNVKIANTTIGDPALDPPAIVDMGFSPQNTLSNKDYLEHTLSLSVNGGGMERTCIPTGPAENLIVRANTDNVVVRAYGLLERPA